MELNRVVVTGLGALTPLGLTVDETWKNILAGKSGAAPITLFDPSKFRTQFACEVKGFKANDFIDRKDARKMDRCTQLGMVAAMQAVADSKMDLDTVDKNRVGVIYGIGIGGIQTFQDEVMYYGQHHDEGPKFSPFFIPKMLAGGAEAAITECGLGGFCSMKALSTRNDDPEHASRPFSGSRDGFVMGEGAACLILETLEHAKARGAHIYAEMAGEGMSADAYHITASHPEGLGAKLVMEAALEDAGMKTSDIDYINVHGTSTHVGDLSEAKAIKDLFGDDAYKLNISSTKSMTGHMLGAAGAAEAMFSVLSVANDVVPPTINHEAGDDDPELDYKLNFTFNEPQKREVRAALSNTFGFGGHNACVIFKKYAE